MNRVPTALAAILALSLGFGTGCNKKMEAAGEAQQALPVKIQVVRAQRVGDYSEFLATLRSRDSSVLQPQVEGQITRIYVHSGDPVQPGARILEIDPLKQEATVRNQEANRLSKLATLEYNRRELERSKSLFAAGVISKQNLDQAQSAYDASKADVEAMEAGVREQQVQLHYYIVKAPAAGIIGDIPVRVGDRVTVSTVLTTLDRGGQLEAYISVPSEKSAVARLGMPVELIADTGPPVRTSVSFVSPRVDSDSQLLLIKAFIPNQDHRFRNAQVLHARVIWKETEMPVVPVMAVSRLSGQMFVFVAESQGGKSVARQKSIAVGDMIGNDYVVLNGIKPGEKLITSGVQVLADGMAVSPES